MVLFWSCLVLFDLFGVVLELFGVVLEWFGIVLELFGVVLELFGWKFLRFVFVFFRELCQSSWVLLLLFVVFLSRTVVCLVPKALGFFMVFSCFLYLFVFVALKS